MDRLFRRSFVHNRLVNDVLDSTRADRGTLALTLDSQTFNVRSALDEVCALVGSYAHRDVTFTTILADNVPATLRCDRTRFQQVCDVHWP